jgi:hypothetical protein
MEKLKCIFNYFRRVTETSKSTIILLLSLLYYLYNLVPNGVITIRRFALPTDLYPSWPDLTTGLCDLHLTTGKKIEDIDSVLQVNRTSCFT